MSDPFLGEIRIFAGNYAPYGWAVCNGQLLSIAQNTALFSLLGVAYGGDGKSTFALPDFQGRAPMSPGQGPGLSPRYLGEQDGSPAVTLQQPQLPAHSHTLQARPVPGNVGSPSANTGSIARPNPASSLAFQADASSNLTTLNPAVIAPYGGDQPHNNIQPYLAMTFIIALQGVFPQRP